jgi:hypothetical protein
MVRFIPTLIVMVVAVSVKLKTVYLEIASGCLKIPICLIQSRDIPTFAPSNAEIKNERFHTSTPSICLHEPDGDTFTFIMIIKKRSSEMKTIDS